MKKIWSDSYEAGWIENTVAGENPLQDPVEPVSQCCGDEVEEAGERGGMWITWCQYGRRK